MKTRNFATVIERQLAADPKLAKQVLDASIEMGREDAEWAFREGQKLMRNRITELVLLWVNGRDRVALLRMIRDLKLEKQPPWSPEESIHAK